MLHKTVTDLISIYIKYTDLKGFEKERKKYAYCICTQRQAFPVEYFC